MRDLLQLQNKVVLVTGSAQGIGRVIAESFAEQGATVIINDREQNNIDKAAALFKEKKYRVIGIKADVSKIEEVSLMVKEIRNNFGMIDILINNAALRKMGIEETIERVSEEEWENLFRVNLIGVKNCCKAVVPLMKEKRHGAIVNISSQAAVFVPRLSGLPYIASKGAVISLTKGLARELGKFNIRVNAVLPGFIQKERKQESAAQQDAFPPALLESIALGRRGLPSEVADVCLFLSSDMASYITGEIIAVSGGMPSVLFL
jgi:NAD(P)-dependent dehydrogenase (short-subunit alcohol dehydrogenase family)